MSYRITKEDRHIILYAKGWYIKDDIKEDLRTLLAERSSIPTKYITDEDILVVLTDIVSNYVNLREFISKLISRMSIYNSDYETSILNTLCSAIKFTSIRDVPIPLGEPDNTLLPVVQ